MNSMMARLWGQISSSSSLSFVQSANAWTIRESNALHSENILHYVVNEKILEFLNMYLPPPASITMKVEKPLTHLNGA